MIPKPYCFNGGWLLPHEVEKALEHGRKVLGDWKWDWDFLLALHCLHEVETVLGPGRARFVFWFED